MFLDSIAGEHVNEQMLAWDEALESFVPSQFLARIAPTDRFLSNFNKPLRRRMMFNLPGALTPESRVVKQPSTGDVYILGQNRGDSLEGSRYVDLRVCHLVTDTEYGSSGLATIRRKQTTGPAENPGWLVDGVVGKAFIDLEFRTSASEEGMYDTKTENFFAFAPAHWQLQAWDYLDLHGKSYRVVDTFADSGLAGLRVDEEPDPRQDFVFTVVGDRTYSSVTHTWSQPPATYNVSGVVVKSHEFSSWLSESEPYIDLVVEAEHVAFNLAPDSVKVSFGGRERTVAQVDEPPGTRQFRLRCK